MNEQDEDHQQFEQRIEGERKALLQQLSEVLQVPMLVLSFLWLVLIIVELTLGLGRELRAATIGIWILFVLQFFLEFVLAPRKLEYLKQNMLTVLALAVPALRVVRAARIALLLRGAGAARGLRLLSILGSANRGMRALRRAMRKRGLGYVMTLTGIVAFLGAAGMSAFEGGPFESYWYSLWWTAMVLTTMGSEIWPKTAEGRILCFILALYAFGVFGYITGSIASFFIGERPGRR